MKRARGLTRGICLAGVLVAVGGAWSNRGGLVALGDVAVSQWLGWGAFIFLLLSQSMAAAARLSLISPTFQAAGRRDFGITSAGLATAHVTFGCLKLYVGHFLEELVNTPWLEAGLAAWILLLTLWLTSYSKLVARLRLRTWKSIHHLAYVALGLAWIHIFDSPWAQRWVVQWLGVLIAALWLLRLRKPSRG